MENNIEIINSILMQILVLDSAEMLTEKTDFVDDCMADSLILISIIVEVESALDIEIPDEDLVFENIRSYAWLCAEVMRLKNE